MKIFTNKKIWQKIVIVILIVMFFQMFLPKPSQALSGDVLLEPVTSLFANLGDGIMSILHKTFMNMDAAGAWVEEKQDQSFWEKIAIAVAAVVIAVVCVAATIMSGGAALTIIAGAATALIKIGIGVAVAFFAVDVLHFGDAGFYLPEFHLTPQSIFKDEILAFDVDFFNPKENVTGEKLKKEVMPSNNTTFNNSCLAVVDCYSYAFNINNNDPVPSFNSYNPNSDSILRLRRCEGGVIWHPGDIYDQGEKVKDYTLESLMERNKKCLNCLEEGEEINLKYEQYVVDGEVTTEAITDRYSFDTEAKNWDGDYSVTKCATFKTKNYIGYCQIKYVYYHGWTSPTQRRRYTSTEDADEKLSSAQELQPVIASWYVAFRNIALVALLSILVYVGIRITLSSTASDKAKYKQMIVDWVVALCLVFLMHYIMSFAVTLNKKIIEVVSSIVTTNLGDVDDFVKDKDDELSGKTKAVSGSEDYGEANLKGKKDDKKFSDLGVQLFIIQGDEANRAYDVLVGKDNDAGSLYYKRFEIDGNNNKTLYWATSDFMAQARLLGQSVDEDHKDQSAVTRAGYNIIYVVLVIYTIFFCFTYLKRVIYMAFLTIIAPLVAITYPIDKMNDGKAQAFDMWLKEYIFNLLIQPMHLVLYTVLVGSAMKFASRNIFYVVVALGFMMPAEKLLRRFFGFEKAQTPGMFAGAAGTALMMSGLNKLLHKPPHALGSGGKNGGGDNSEDDGKVPTLNKSVEGSSCDTEDNALPNNNPGGNNPNDDDPLPPGGNQDDDDDDPLPPGGNQDDDDDVPLPPGGGDSDGDDDIYSRRNRRNGNGDNEWSRRNRRRNNEWSRRKGKRRLRRAMGGALRAKGRKINKYRDLRNGQMAALLAKKGLGLGTKVATAGLAASAAGLASIATGNPQAAAQNMIIAGSSGYAVGKGVAGKIENSSRQAEIDAAREGFWGDDAEKSKEFKARKRQFRRDEENLKKIEKKLKVDRGEAKRIAKEMADYTQYDGIDNIDQTIGIYNMVHDEGYNATDACYAASYNNVALNGANTNNMKDQDRNAYRNGYVKALVSKGVGQADAEQKADRLFDAMDRYNNLK